MPILAENSVSLGFPCTYSFNCLLLRNLERIIHNYNANLMYHGNLSKLEALKEASGRACWQVIHPLSFSSNLLGEANEIKIASHLPVWDQLFQPASTLLIIRLNQTQAVQIWHWLHLGSCSEGSRVLILLLPPHGMDVSGRKGSQTSSEDLSSVLGGQNYNLLIPSLLQSS